MKFKAILCKKIFFAAMIPAFFCGLVFSQSYQQGLELFFQNKPAEAVVLFEQSLSEPELNPDVYVYLGLANYQTAQYEKALEWFRAGLSADGSDLKLLYYNAGNAAFSMQDYNLAEEYYTYALSANPDYSAALLNRANTRMQLQKLKEAVEDYNAYILADADSPQAEQIKKLIALISAEEERERIEKERLAIENERIKAEQERLARERELLEKERAEAEAARKLEEERLAAEMAEKEAARKAEEAERRKKLLQDVADALKSAESESMSAGTHGLMEYNSEDEDLD